MHFNKGYIEVAEQISNGLKLSSEFIIDENQRSLLVHPFLTLHL